MTDLGKAPPPHLLPLIGEHTDMNADMKQQAKTIEPRKRLIKESTDNILNLPDSDLHTSLQQRVALGSAKDVHQTKTIGNASPATTKGRGEGWEGWEKRGRKPGEVGKHLQHCIIFCNRKSTNWQEAQRKGREPGLQGTGSGKFSPPCIPLPPPPFSPSPPPTPFSRTLKKIQVN